MLKFKQKKDGKVVMTENSETGEIKVFDEKLKEVEDLSETVEDKEEKEKK